MPNNAVLDARLDAIAAHMPRLRRDFAQVFGDPIERADSPRPVKTDQDPQVPSDRDEPQVDRAAPH